MCRCGAMRSEVRLARGGRGAAVDRQHRTGHVCRVTARQEQDRSHDVFGRSGAPQCNPVREGGEILVSLSHAACHVGQGECRRDRVETHTAAPVVEGKRTDQPVHRMLGGVVCSLPPIAVVS